MLPNSEICKQENVAIAASGLEIPIGIANILDFSLILPSPAELDGIKELSSDKIKIKHAIRETKTHINAAHEIERDKLLKRYDRFKDSPVYLNKLASMSKWAGNIDSAIEYWNTAQKLEPSDQHFMSELSLARLEAGEDPTSVYNDILKTGNNDIQSLLIGANIALSKGEITEASKILNSALTKDSTDVNALGAAALINLLSGDTKSSVKIFRLAISENMKPKPELYLGLAIAHILNGETNKGAEALRIAVALNPIYRPAVHAYSDLLAQLDKQQLAISVLSSSLSYDENDIDGWDRIAHSYFRTKQYRESLNALRNRASIKVDSSTWSNMGVVYWRLKDNKKALEFFVKSITEMEESEDEVNWLAITNTLSFLSKQKMNKELLAITRSLFELNNMNDIAQIPVAATICSFHVCALAENGFEDDAITLAHKFLNQEYDDELRLRLLFFTTYYHTLLNYDETLANEYASVSLRYLDNHPNLAKYDKALLLNNVVYTYLEIGKIETAEALLSKLSQYFHKDATITATLGLLHFKKGNEKKGTDLYLEAANLAIDCNLTARIKQKTNLELGKVAISAGQPRKAAKILSKVAKQKDGLKSLNNQAAQLVRCLK